MNRLTKLLVIALVVAPVLALGGLAQQQVRVWFNEYLFLDCSASPDIDYIIRQEDLEYPGPIPIGPWACNVDALSQFRLNSTMETVWAAHGATVSNFLQICEEADRDGDPPATCADGWELDPAAAEISTRRGTGGNTAGTDGADFSGTIYFILKEIDIPKYGPNYGLLYHGVITYVVSDLTP